MSIEHEKRLAAEAAAELVESDMMVGLGTGSTVAFLLTALARRRLSFRCVASSPHTERLALSLGLHVEPFKQQVRLDLTIDSADQIAWDGWLNKGRGGAHTREKIIAAASDRFVIIGDSTKQVPEIQSPVPVELLTFGLSATLRRLDPITLRGASPSPDGGVIADFHGLLSNPAAVATWLDSIPGVVQHGLFPPGMATEAFIAKGSSVERVKFTPDSLRMTP